MAVIAWVARAVLMVLLVRIVVRLVQSMLEELN